MAGNAAYPRIWAGADLYIAPVGTAGPTDIATALNAAFIALGLLADDGITESRDDDVTNHYAHGSLLVRTTRSKHVRTIQALMIEDNKTVYAAANPGSTAATVSTITTRTTKVPIANPQAFVCQLTDGTNVKRLWVPNGEISQVGDRVFSDSAMTVTPLTITVYADATGILYKEITNDAQAVFP